MTLSSMINYCAAIVRGSINTAVQETHNNPERPVTGVYFQVAGQLWHPMCAIVHTLFGQSTALALHKAEGLSPDGFPFFALVWPDGSFREVFYADDTGSPGRIIVRTGYEKHEPLEGLPTAGDILQALDDSEPEDTEEFPDRCVQPGGAGQYWDDDDEEPEDDEPEGPSSTGGFFSTS